MIKNLTLLTGLAVLSTSVCAAESDLQAQIDALNAKIEKMEKVESYQNKQISKVNQQSANDNIKWDIDYRAAYDYLNYKYRDDAKTATGADDTANAGKTYTNSALLTSRLWLGMAASPFEGLTFHGQLAVYGYWGAENTNEVSDKSWRGSSRPHDWTVRFREGNFVYKFGNDWAVPMTASVGRRPSSMGFLANHRDGDAKPNSPLAHITNMEADAAMVMFDFSKTLLPGSFLKVVYGRAHDPVAVGSTTPYIDPENVATDDAAVDFLVLPISIYNNGQSNLMAQYAMILNSKGTNIEGATPIKKAGAGTTHMGALSYQLDGLNEDIDFFDASTLFASAAATMTDPDSGYEMLGSTKRETGYSFWAGFLFPDMMTDGGRFGLEYNWGSKYWTPMTWAEDTILGSKIATRGSAYEGYWNIPIEGKNLSAQLRYTYIDYSYRANTTCYWDDPADKNLDSAQDLRLYVRYQY